jgi:hypothetical protein
MDSLPKKEEQNRERQDVQQMSRLIFAQRKEFVSDPESASPQRKLGGTTNTHAPLAAAIIMDWGRA